MFFVPYIVNYLIHTFYSLKKIFSSDKLYSNYDYGNFIIFNDNIFVTSNRKPTFISCAFKENGDVVFDATEFIKTFAKNVEINTITVQKVYECFCIINNIKIFPLEKLEVISEDMEFFDIYPQDNISVLFT